jgi:putative hydrolase of HD superfamily
MSNSAGDDLARRIAFVLEIDRLKEVERRTHVLESGRRENSAEHSWHVALMAAVLHPYANEPLDLLHTIKMLLVHDIVEIDAGDTFAYADQSSKAADETEAAVRIFGLLPDVQRKEFVTLWEEFEARSTPEARFANAMDRLMPALHNYYGGGGTWREHNVTRGQVEQRLAPIGDGTGSLWAWLQPLLDEAVARGDIAP